MYHPCANCGEKMLVTSVKFITPIGLVSNICSDECLKQYNNNDFSKIPEAKKEVKKC